MRYIERLVETDSTLNYRVNSNDENHVTLILNEDGSYSISSFISDETITGNTDTTIYEMTGGWNTDNDTITFEENTEDVSVYDNFFYISADVLTLFNTYGGGEYDFLLSYLYDRKWLTASYYYYLFY